MKVLKIIGKILVVLLVLFLVVPIFLSSDYSLERSVVIDQANDLVFEQVVNFEHRASWDPWIETEPQAKTTITGEPGKAGSTWSWEGKELGSGSLTIDTLEVNRSITAKLHFTAPREDNAMAYWVFQPQDSSKTNVTWKFESKLDYPMGKWFGLMMDGMMSPKLEKGLDNLKQRCESLEAAAPQDSTLTETK